MVDLGWILLGETPDAEIVLGQVGRPWKGVAVSADLPTTPEQFTSFDEPGFAKIATSLRVDPYGNDSILTMETRVAITDDTSRRPVQALLAGHQTLQLAHPSNGVAPPLDRTSPVHCRGQMTLSSVAILTVACAELGARISAAAHGQRLLGEFTQDRCLANSV